MATTKEVQNIDMQQNELQNACGHNVNATPQDVKESQFWYDTVAKVFKFFNGTAVKLFGKEYTFSTGLTNTSDTITVTDYDKLYKNTATGTDSMNIGGISTTANTSISIGTGSSVNGSANRSIAIGKDATVGGNDSTAIGYGATTVYLDSECTALGSGAQCQASDSIAIGYGAIAAGGYSIQIGQGLNTNNYSLQIGFGSQKQYQLLDGSSGLIIDDRLSNNIARTSAIGNAEIEIQKNGTKVDSFTTNQSGNKKTINITVPTTVASLSDANTYAKKTDVANIFSPSGSVASASDLPTLSASVLGNVYRVTTSFNTTSDFVEGSGKPLAVGNSIVVINVGTSANPSYKFDVYGDFIDISGKQDVIDSSHKLSADLISDGITNKTVTQTEKDGWDGKQNAISDLATIRSGAALGATALQPVRNDLITLLGFEPVRKYVYNNPSLTVSGGQVTWSIANPFSSRTDSNDIIVQVFDDYDVAVGCEIDIGTSNIYIKMNSATNVSANSYKAVIMG